MDEQRQRTVALLRVHAGHPRAEICRDLGIPSSLLAAWEATTPASALRPPDHPFIAATLTPAVEGLG